MTRLIGSLCSSTFELVPDPSSLSRLRWRRGSRPAPPGQRLEDHRRIAGKRPLLAAAALLLLTAAGARLGARLLTVLPFLVLLVALACGRYPGEAVIRRVGGTRPRRAPRAPAIRRPAFAIRSCGPRGSELIAWEIAARPPPGRRLSFGC